MSEFQSKLITLNDVIDQQFFFNIPIYQRLYVWGKEQIHTLLDDIVAAWLEKKNEFYLGGTLVIERAVNGSEDMRYFDLIDGQQRFTTLWLISVVLKEHLAAYIQADTKQGKRLRISFSIRPQVTKFFEKVCEGLPASLPEAMQLEDALQEIRAYFDNYPDKKEALDKRALSEFILTKVQLILTTVPDHTDLNKLFEVINNRGVQLQHHEILKAKLLEKIENHDEREAYALLWDACANMNGYVERHLKATTKLDTVSLYEKKVDFKNGEREQLANAKAVLDELRKITKASDDQSMKLEEILNQTEIVTTSENDPGEEIDSGLPDRVTSIITFPMLLQHVLRIYLQQKKTVKQHDIEKISDKDLLFIFKKFWLDEKPNETDAKQFLELLWDVRYQFDKHVIKWILVEEEKQHAIRRMRINYNKKQDTYYLQRETKDASPDFALLQSMLYHSQQMTTQYWLTPLLKFLLENNSDGAELYLQHLDNHLLCSRIDESLIKRTHRFLQNLWHEEDLIDATESLGQQYENGTQYPHYWFYKLEYVLYLKLKRTNSRLVDNFKITAKNSVEHVTPQNPEQKQDEIPTDILHNFGNLALVTKSINSELSNDGFSIKKEKFKQRHKGKGVSLKLEDVFANTQWKEAEIKAHQQKMIDDFNEYMRLVCSQTDKKKINEQRYE